jgi:hypothetical protein
MRDDNRSCDVATVRVCESEYPFSFFERGQGPLTPVESGGRPGNRISGETVAVVAMKHGAALVLWR